MNYYCNTCLPQAKAKLPTVPAFVYDFPTGDFDEVTRSHPALAFLEKILRTAIEPNKFNINPEDNGVEATAYLITPAGPYVDDPVYQYRSLARLHEKFVAIRHQFDHIVVYETDWGYKSVGTANVYSTTTEFLASGEIGTETSHDGRKWEKVSRGLYMMSYRDHGGMDIQLEGLKIHNMYLSKKEWIDTK